MEQVGIDVVFSPRLLTASQILRFVRSGEGVYLFPPLKVVKPNLSKLKLPMNQPVAGKQLKDIRLPGRP